jgi:hypothetical protein
MTARLAHQRGDLLMKRSAAAGRHTMPGPLTPSLRRRHNPKRHLQRNKQTLRLYPLKKRSPLSGKIEDALICEMAVS